MSVERLKPNLRALWEYKTYCRRRRASQMCFPGSLYAQQLVSERSSTQISTLNARWFSCFVWWSSSLLDVFRVEKLHMLMKHVRLITLCTTNTVSNLLVPINWCCLLCPCPCSRARQASSLQTDRRESCLVAVYITSWPWSVSCLQHCSPALWRKQQLPSLSLTVFYWTFLTHPFTPTSQPLLFFPGCLLYNLSPN